MYALTLAPLLRLLRLTGDGDDRDEVHARIAATDATDAALDRLRELEAEPWTQHRRLVQLRDAGEVPADVVQRIGHELDLEDSRLDS